MNEEQKMTEFSLLVPTHYLRAVMLMASQDETRRTICGVRVEVDGRHVTLVGVDGLRLLAVRYAPWPNSTEPLAEAPLAFTLPLSMLKMLRSGRSKADKTLVARYPDSTVGVDLSGTAGKMMLRGPQPGGTFPPWRAVTPLGALKPVDGPQFNVRMAHEIWRAVSMLSAAKPGYEPGMCPWSEDGLADKVMVWRLSSPDLGVETLAIQMPMRMYCDEWPRWQVPEWAKPKEVPPEVGNGGKDGKGVQP